MSIEQGEVLAFIPARGNSKGLPRKNSRLLAGKPLLAWTIEVALRARRIARVLVSTEDEELAEIATRYGAEVPFLRPAELSQDNSLIGQALDYTLQRLAKEDYRPQCIVELYPTHPFRTPGLLDSLTEKLLAGYSEVSTVKAVSIHPQAFATTDAQGRLCTLPEPDAGSGGHAYRRYGQFHGWRLESHPAARYRGYAHVITNPVELVDIDYLADFYLAEYLISNNLYDFR